MRIILGSCKPRVGSDVTDRPLELALRASGCDVLACDWQDETVNWSDCDAVFVRTTWTWMQDPIAFRNWIDLIANQTRVFNTPELLQWNLDKSYLSYFENKQLAIVPSLFQTAIDFEAVKAACEKWKTRKLVIKSSLGAGAISQHLLDCESEELVMLAKSGFPKFGKALVQPYLESVAIDGEISAVFIDGVLSHAIKKQPKAGDYRVQAEYGAKHVPIRLSGDYLELATSTVAALPEPALVVRVDMVQGPDCRPCLIEVEAVEPDLAWFADSMAPARLADRLLLKLSLEDF